MATGSGAGVDFFLLIFMFFWLFAFEDSARGRGLPFYKIEGALYIKIFFFQQYFETNFFKL